MSQPITLYDTESFQSCTLTQHPQYAYIKMLMSAKPCDLIANLPESIQYYALQVDDELTLLAQVRTEKDKTYTASLLSHYFDYLQQELDLTHQQSRCGTTLLKKIIATLGTLFYHQRLDDVVYIGNLFLSTNFHPNWSEAQLKHIDTFARQRFTTPRIVYRSLNTYANQPMMKYLEKLGYRRIISRQVFITDQTLESLKKYNNIKQDIALQRNTPLSVRRIDQDIERYAKTAKSLYDALYLNKYSYYNPQLTLRYFIDTVKQQAITLYGVFDDTQLVAIAGLYRLNNMLTTALIGYDTHYPKKAGLYRLASLISFQQIAVGQVLNMSSGAGDYKIRRGAQVYLEYSYYTDVNLSWFKRCTFRLFASLLNKIGETYGKRHIF